MCDAIENIKSEIKGRLIARKLTKVVIQIEKITNWYRTLESKYITNTPDGKKVIFPPNIHNTVNKNLTIGYEILVQYLEKLELL